MNHCLSITALTILLSTTAWGRTVSYKVTNKEGELYSWSGLEAGWTPVKTNGIYRENTILQSIGPSSLTLKETKNTVRGTPKTVMVSSKSRVIFRLSDSTMRKVILSNNFVKSVDTGVLDNEKDKDEELDIMSAWRKIASLGKVSGKIKGTDNTNVGSKDERTKTSLDTSFERIEFSYPSKGGILVPDQLPLLVPVIWKHSGNSEGCYEVFLKPSTSSEFQRVAAVSTTRHDLKIREPGSYMVRIQCASGKARSEELTFSILPVNAAEWQKPVKTSK